MKPKMIPNSDDDDRQTQFTIHVICVCHFTSHVKLLVIAIQSFVWQQSSNVQCVRYKTVVMVAADELKNNRLQKRRRTVNRSRDDYAL